MYWGQGCSVARSLEVPCLLHYCTFRLENVTVDTARRKDNDQQNLFKQAVGGRPPWYAPPRPATEARSGSLEPCRSSRARSANTRHPAGRPHTPPADRMYATGVRQTDVRQHHRLMPPERGHKNDNDIAGNITRSLQMCEDTIILFVSSWQTTNKLQLVLKI